MTEKLSYYDALAHLIPGTIGCLFLFYLFNMLGIALPAVGVGELGIVGIGIALAYTLGHLLQSLASSLEPVYYLLWGGKPSIRLLTTESRQFSEEQRQELVGKLREFFKIKEAPPKGHDESNKYHQRLFERCMTLCNRKQLGRVDSFNAIYGFHRVLLTTFLLGFVTYTAIWAAQHWGIFAFPAAKLPLLKLLIFLTCVGLAIEIFRTRKRAYYYAREVLWMTLDYIREPDSAATGHNDSEKKS